MMSKINLELRRVKATNNEDKNNVVVVHVFPEESNAENEDLAMSKILWPITFSMMCFGMVWKAPDGQTTTRCGYYHTFHCVLTMLVTWINALHYFIVYESGLGFEGNVMVLLCHILAIECAACTTALIYCHNKHLPFFLRQWENYKLKHGGTSMNVMKRVLFRKILGFNLSLGIFLFMFFLGSILLPRGEFFDKTKHILMPLLTVTPKSSSTDKAVEALYTVVHFYTTMAWGVSAVVVSGLCYLLSREYRKLSIEFAQNVEKHQKEHIVRSELRRSNSQGTMNASNRRVFNYYAVEQFRLRHQELAFLVGRLDKVMHTYLLLLYMFAIPVIVLVVFTLGVSSSQPPEMVIIFRGIMGIMFFVGILICVTYAGTSLAESANLSKSKIQTIDMSQCSLEESMSVQVLLLKFANDHVGLTLGRFINIDKRLFITLFTTIITYLVISLKVSTAFGGKHEEADNGTVPVTLTPMH